MTFTVWALHAAKKKRLIQICRSNLVPEGPGIGVATCAAAGLAA